MDAATLRYFHEKLTALKDELLDLGSVAAPTTVQGDGKRDDDAQPLNEMHQSIASTRNKNRAELLEKVEEALELIADAPDEYGLCEECETEIPHGRLELMPYATSCVRCQSKRESPRGRGRRHLTDYKR
ncbi:MAG: TraR/DksA family transcriptional regulator [Bradymonadia bacterium]